MGKSPLVHGLFEAALVSLSLPSLVLVVPLLGTPAMCTAGNACMLQAARCMCVCLRSCIHACLHAAPGQVAMARPPPQRDDPDSRYGRGAPYRTPYPSAYPPPGPAAPRGSGPGGYASRAGGYGGGGPRDAGRPGPRGRGYDDGYGDGGYADDGYGEDYDQG